jgi:adenylate cyclase
VTEETADVLEQFGVTCSHRGDIFVKGKGVLPTYFVLISDELEFIKNDSKSTHFPFETKL